MELLAPAGSPDMLKLAVEYGADAVYLGLEQFNARIKATNFNSDNLSEWVDYCHLRGVKVYLAINTMIFDHELDQLKLIILDGLKAGVDAFIVTDIAAIVLIKGICPDIPIHLSTQSGINNLEGALIAKRMGISRVILARETSISEIKRIIQNCDIEIEIFVHGALCASFSGNCQLSYVENGNSGNRGKCKQLCRQRYTTNMTDDESYLISPKDLCLINRVEELVDLGVASFKIEGRLKSNEYVAATVSAYRSALDGIDYTKKIDDLKITYNRGDFTEGYIDSSNDGIIERRIQNHLGLPIGKVIRTTKNGKFNVISFISNRTLIRGDAVKVVDENYRELGGGEVNYSQSFWKDGIYTFYSTANIKQESIVRLTKSSSVYNDIVPYDRRLTVDFNITILPDRAISVFYKRKDVENTLYFNKPTKAIDTPLSSETVYRCFSKIKPLSIAKYECNTRDSFLPVSMLNDIRRQVYNDIIEKTRIKWKINYDYNLKHVGFNNVQTIELHIVHNAYDIIDDGKSYVLFPSNYNDLIYNSEKIVDYIKNSKTNVYLYVPSFLTLKDIEVLYRIGILHNNIFSGLLVNNLSGIYIAEKLNYKYIIGQGMNIANNASSNYFDAYGVVTSIESRPIMIHQRQYRLSKNSLMTFIYCPIKSIGSTCNKCKYHDNILYAREKKVYKLHRYILDKCYFMLYNN